MPSNNPAHATPEMVEQLSGQGEVELNLETGEARPLSSQNQADPSQQASQAGATAEPAGSAPEPQSPSTTQTPVAPAGEPQAPAQQVVEPAPTPVVEVVPPTAQQPAPAPVPAAPAPAAATPEATPEDEAAALGRLGTFLQEQRTEIVGEAQRAAQSQNDKRAAQFDRQLQESQVRAKELTTQMRELQTRDLTDAERATALEKYAQDDEKAELAATRDELVGYHKAVVVEGLLFEYRDYEVGRDALEAIETPEEMELYCEHQKSSFLEKKLAAGQAPAEPAVPATPEVPVAPAAAVAPEPQPQPNAGVPAGASAPTDIGSPGAIEESKKFSEEAGAGAMQQNLKNMDWNTVRVRQA